MVFVRLYQRVSRSYDVALESYEERVAAGVQPSTRVVDLFNVMTQEALLLCANFLYLGLVILLYLRMLKRKGPVRLRAVMLGYNTLNVCISLFVACSLLYFKVTSRGAGGGEALAGRSGGEGVGGGFVCNPLRTDAQGQRVAQVFAVFYLQKYLELVDTILFLLRRSFRQVTFFHLFHHCSITVIVGSVLPFDFNGDMYLPIMLNSIVHVLVYLHYVLTALGRHSWWSRHLTSLQLTQFVVIFVQSAAALYYGPSCGSPDFVKVVLLFYMGSLLGLFALFFAKRSLLGPAEDPGMCGVIKSLENDGAAGVGRGAAAAVLSWHGNVALDARGEAEVRLPAGFLEKPATGGVYSYQLTPIGAPMPELFVANEICRSTTVSPGGLSFSVKGGKAGSTVSWTVSTAELQSNRALGEAGGGGGARTPRSDSSSEDEGWGTGERRLSREDEGWGAEEEAGRVAATRCVTSSELQCKTALGKGNEGGGGEDRVLGGFAHGGGGTGARAPRSESSSEDEIWGVEEEAESVAAAIYVTTADLHTEKALAGADEGVDAGQGRGALGVTRAARMKARGAERAGGGTR
eukprot:jgi/Undpi1/5097/HiC_scaffold_19.g08449.m1